MIKTYNDHYDIQYDPDKYAAPFFPVAEELAAQASSEEPIGRADEAQDLYLRAAALYRIARFPIDRSPQSERAWEANKAAYLKASRYMNPPNHEYIVEHKHAGLVGGDEPGPIAAYVRPPIGFKPSNG